MPRIAPNLLGPACLVLALLVLPAVAIAGEGDQDCLKCHADRDALTKALKDKSRPLDRLLVDVARYKRSVHFERGCAECHFDYDSHPHSDEAETAQCAECHEEANEAFSKSPHSQTKEGNPRLPVHCSTCHGLHDVFKTTDRDSPLFPLNVHETCGQCHFDPQRTGTKDLLRDRYTADAHGHGLTKAGLIVSATCVSCHGGHAIRHVRDPDSRVARHNVDVTCGKCHLGALEDYRKSIHHLKSKGTEHKGATCTDCHYAHHISKATPDFRKESVRACSNCHDQRAGSFRLTYHGKVSSLGFGGAIATCESCHNNHVILPASNPNSAIHKDHIVETCARCHEGSHREFTNYMVHADYRDGEKYPRVHFVYQFMTWLLIVVLILGVTHALLWLVRALAAGEWRRPARPKAPRYLRRWRWQFVAYHVWLMTTVLLLATTGLPLHFADKEWSVSVMNFFGGPAVTSWIHRASAIAMGLLAVVYLIDVAVRVLRRKEKLFTPGNTMLPRWKDIQDLIGNVKWFLFLAPRPKYDRWTYWEKFDFWAVFWGLIVIGLTGLILWFPVEATRIVPGWFVNAAIVIHGIEALLDIAFIFTVHVFNANLRPDKFPMDPMFWTGRMTEEEFRHERPEEYERAVAEGTYEAMVARTPRVRTRAIAYVIGGCALLVGFFFVAMMIVAVIQGAG